MGYGRCGNRATFHLDAAWDVRRTLARMDPTREVVSKHARDTNSKLNEFRISFLKKGEIIIMTKKSIITTATAVATATLLTATTAAAAATISSTAVAARTISAKELL